MLDDQIPEPDETLKLIIDGVSGLYGSVSHEIKIVDDDRLGAVLPMPSAPVAPQSGMNLAVRHDHKFLVWSGLSPWQPLDRPPIALLEADGTIEPSFQAPACHVRHKRAR